MVTGHELRYFRKKFRAYLCTGVGQLTLSWGFQTENADKCKTCLFGNENRVITESAIPFRAIENRPLDLSAKRHFLPAKYQCYDCDKPGCAHLLVLHAATLLAKHSSKTHRQFMINSQAPTKRAQFSYPSGSKDNSLSLSPSALVLSREDQQLC